jgi:hypothetical protein
MKKISIMVILFFTLAGLTTGCSTDFSKEKHQAMKGKKSLEEKSYAKVPKAPPSALNGLGEGELFDAEHDSSFE